MSAVYAFIEAEKTTHKKEAPYHICAERIE